MDYFALLGLPQHFALDQQQLEENYLKLATQCHPDRHAHLSAFEQKQAMMMSSSVNEAYRVLKSPLERAVYLISKQGIDTDAPEHTQYPADFLMQQMMWREHLDEANSAQELSELQQEIKGELAQIILSIEQNLNQQQWQIAAENVRKGRFLDKLLRIIQDKNKQYT